MTARRPWYEYLWIASAVYLALGFFNILFAWLGMACFLIPLVISISRGSKAYCNRYCGRGQLFSLMGHKFGWTLNRPMPAFLKSRWFRYGFLTFFMSMFIGMIYNTYLVFTQAMQLSRTVTLLWSFRLPWNRALAEGAAAPWVAQFAFGFYSIMLTSSLIGVIFMVLFKPRAWCVICPMGTMTQLVCMAKARGAEKEE